MIPCLCRFIVFHNCLLTGIKERNGVMGKEKALQNVTHTFEPIVNEASEILILGTFPSVKSRENLFYYGHPQNRFWKVISAVMGEALPLTVEEKKTMLYRNHIAIWDVIASCDICGSSDSSIQNVIPNPIEQVIKASCVTFIYGNGDKACRLYEKYCLQTVGMPIKRLPSTSPANAVFSLEKLIEEWSCITGKISIISAQ